MPYTIKVQNLIFFLLFFQRTRQQLLQDRVCLLTAYGYAKLRDYFKIKSLTDYLILLRDEDDLSLTAFVADITKINFTSLITSATNILLIVSSF